MQTFTAWHGTEPPAALWELADLFTVRDGTGRDWFVSEDAAAFADLLTAPQPSCTEDTPAVHTHLLRLTCPDRAALTARLTAESQYERDHPHVSHIALRQLPLWARAAFAIRCARQARALFPPGDGPDVLAEALDAAERSAAAGLEDSGLRPILELAVERRRELLLADRARPQEPLPWLACGWAKAATSPGLAIALAADLSLSTAAADDAFEAAHDGARALNAGGLLTSLRSDFARVLHAATAGSWTDATPCPMSIFDADGPAAA